MHTHFASATHGAATFLTVVVFGTFWRLSAMHMVKNRRIGFIRGLGRGMLFQY